MNSSKKYKSLVMERNTAKEKYVLTDDKSEVHLKLQQLSKELRNSSTALWTNSYWSCSERAKKGIKGTSDSEDTKKSHQTNKHTRDCNSPARRVLMDFTVWNTSTTCSVLTRSKTVKTAQNVPVLPRPSLREQTMCNRKCQPKYRQANANVHVRVHTRIVPAVDSDGTVARLPLDSQQVSNEINERRSLLGAFAGRPLEIMELSNGSALLRLEMKLGKGVKKEQQSQHLTKHAPKLTKSLYYVQTRLRLVQIFRTCKLNTTWR